MAATLAEKLKTALMNALGRTRLCVQSIMIAERLWPLILPFLLVAGLFAAVSWLGLFRIMPEWMRLGVLAIAGLAAFGSLYLLRFYKRPSRAEIDRRIERVNRLEHAPVHTQDDHLPGGAADNAFADALWREHQKRMAGLLGRLSADMPRSRIPERDPWALRAAVALLLVVAFAFSFGPLGGRLGDGFQSHGTGAAVSTRIDAWVTPPSYTGRAPVYLTADANSQTGRFRVPDGSEVVVRVTGGHGGERLVYQYAHSNEEAELAAGDNVTGKGASSQFEGRLVRDGLLALTEENGTQIEQWSFAIIPDEPPVIRFAEDPQRAANGALELIYEIEDDYGAVSAEALFEQAHGSDDQARPLYQAPEMALSLPRGGPDEDNAARTSRDLTTHPWAGTIVELTLAATDGAGQDGHSETQTFRLPERPFDNPLARALVEQRQILALDANAKSRVLAMMDGLTLRPEDTFEEMAHFLGIKSARTRLSMAASDDQLRDVVNYLWEIALVIEDGALVAAEQRLQQAQEALQQALEDQASAEEIEELMDELREAMQEYLREFAERAQQDLDNAMQMPGEGQEFRQSVLDDMLDQIEDMARSGAHDQAQAMLSELQDMMNNLQAGRQQQDQGQQGEMQQQMDELGNIMRRQQEMMNETFRTDQMQRAEPGDSGDPGGQSMSPEDIAEALRDLQEGQGQLQQDLGELAEALEGMGLEPGEGFGDAGEAMGRAEGALGEQMGERAVGEQGQALQSLRQGAQEMMQQMQQAMEGQPGGGQQQGQEQGGNDRDPLGRPRATTGPDFGDSVRVPDEADVQRARQILDEIRRRLGNTLSPEIERDYLERLLDLR